jgi:hypothetical protein
MNRLKRILLTACFSIVCLGYYGQSWGADWTFYYQTEVEDEIKTIVEKYYYDKASIERPQKNILKFTQRITIMVKGSEETDKKVMQTEMNCASRQYRVLSQTEYDVATGKVITEGTMESPVWKRFSLDSVMGDLRDNICFEKTQKKEPEKKQKDKEPDKQKDKGLDQPKDKETKK